MRKRVLVVAPHPDDETLGCAGTLLAMKDKGYDVYWLIVTSMTNGKKFSKARIAKREHEINSVNKMFGFKEYINMHFPTAEMDQVSDGYLIERLSEVYKDVKPNIIFIPNGTDVHTDHQIIFRACISCSKWFRYKFIEKVLVYETVSETNFNIAQNVLPFRPNIYVDIEEYLDKKVEIMKIYESELKAFPFPRSEKAIRSLAYIRGSESGFHAAEAFELLRASVSL